MFVQFIVQEGRVEVLYEPTAILPQGVTLLVRIETDKTPQEIEEMVAEMTPALLSRAKGIGDELAERGLKTVSRPLNLSNVKISKEVLPQSRRRDLGKKHDAQQRTISAG